MYGDVQIKNLNFSRQTQQNIFILSQITLVYAFTLYFIVQRERERGIGRGKSLATHIYTQILSYYSKLSV